MRAGTLVVDIAANVARLQQDMASAKGVVESSMREITNAVNVAKGAFAALGVGVGVGVFTNMIRETIEMEAGLIRLAQKSASTVEAISSLTAVARRSSTDMDDVAKGMQKLAKSMAEAGDGSSKAGKVFDALGVSVKDANGQLLPAQQVMQDLGTKLASMKDQTLAVAFAQETMGKAGANLLPFLYELASAGQLNAKVTTDQAKAAKEFEDNLKALEASGRAFRIELANYLLPGLIDFTNQLLAAKEAGFGLMGALGNVIAFRLNPKTTSEQIASVDAELANRRAGNELMARMPGYGAAIEGNYKYIGGLQAQRNFLLRQQASEALSGSAALGDVRDARDLSLVPRPLNVANPLGSAGGTAAAKDDYTPLARGAQDRIAMLYAEQAATGPLTEAQKVMVKLQADLTNGYIKLTPEQAKALKGWLDEEDALERAKRAAEEWKKLQMEIFNSRKQFFDQQGKTIESMATENTRIREQNEEIGKTVEQVNALRLARMDEMIQKAERDRLAQSAGGAEEIEIQNLTAEIELLKQRRDLMAQGQVAQAAADQARAAADAFRKTANTIDTALTTAIANGLMHGFRDKGGSIVKDFVRMLEDAVKGAILTPIIRAIVAPISNSIASIVGGVSNSILGGGGGGGFGLGNLSSLGNLFPGGNPITNAISSALGIGGGAALSGTALSGEIAALTGTSFGAGAVGAAGIGIGAAIPYVGLAFAALSLMGAFGGGGGPKPSQIWLQGAPGGSFNIGEDDIPGGINPAQLAALNAALADPKQYDPSIMQGLAYHRIQGGPGEGADAMIQRLLAMLAPAANAAGANSQMLQAQFVAQGQITQSLQQFFDSMKTSPFLSPTDRYAGARSIFEDTLAKARAGDASALQALGGSASTLLSAGRDVFASGPQFAELMKEVNGDIGDLLQRSQDAQAKILAEISPSIKQASTVTVAAIQDQTLVLGDKLDKLSQDLRGLVLAVG